MGRGKKTQIFGATLRGPHPPFGAPTLPGRTDCETTKTLIWAKIGLAKVGQIRMAKNGLAENGLSHRYAVVLQNLATQWVQTYPCKSKFAQETQKNTIEVPGGNDKSESHLC